MTIQMTVSFCYTGRVHHLNIAIDDIGCGCERDKSTQETHNSFNAFFVFHHNVCRAYTVRNVQAMHLLCFLNCIHASFECRAQCTMFHIFFPPYALLAGLFSPVCFPRAFFSLSLFFSCASPVLRPSRRSFVEPCIRNLPRVFGDTFHVSGQKHDGLLPSATVLGPCVRNMQHHHPSCGLLVPGRQ